MKRIIAVATVLIMLALTALPAGAVVALTSIDKPYDVMYSVYDDNYAERISISCLLTDNLAAMTAMSEEKSMEKYGIKSMYAYIQADYRIDGGKWHSTDAWETTPSGADYGCQVMPGETVKTFDLFYLANDSAVKDAGALAKIDAKGKRTFNLDEHSLEFRIRVSLGYTMEDPRTINSEWTEIVEVKRGKNFGERPTTLEAPTISNPQVLYNQTDECPYLSFYFRVPESVKAAEAWFSTQEPTYISTICYLDNGSGTWAESQYSNPSSSFFSNEDKFIYLSAGDVDDEKVMKVKIKYVVYLGEKTLYSEESDVLTFKTPRWVEGKGITHAKCKVCGVCRPIFGICMFIWLAILLVAAIVVAVPLKMHSNKVKALKAFEEEEKKRKEEEERAAKKAAKSRK